MKILIVFVFVWSLLWKGIALWKSARNAQKVWFVSLLILQTLGILEILYIFIFQKDRNFRPSFDLQDEE